MRASALCSASELHRAARHRDLLRAEQSPRCPAQVRDGATGSVLFKEAFDAASTASASRAVNSLAYVTCRG